MKATRVRQRQTWPLFPFCCGLFSLTSGIAPAGADEAAQAGNSLSHSQHTQTPNLRANAALAAELRQAIEQADIAKFDRLTNGDASKSQVGVDSKGRTALMYAADAGNLEAIHKLICLDGTGNWVWNPQIYHSAPHLRGISAPLSIKDYINLCDKMSDDPADPTHGFTALMHASDKKHVEAVNYLLNAGADPAKRCRYAQFTALQLAQNAGDALSAAAIEHNLTAYNAEKAEAKTEAEQNKWYNSPVMKSLATVLSVVSATISIGVIAWMRSGYKKIGEHSRLKTLRESAEEAFDNSPVCREDKAKNPRMREQVVALLIETAGANHEAFTSREAEAALRAIRKAETPPLPGNHRTGGMT